MKKVLIVVSGEFGISFVQRLSAAYAGESHYDIIIYNTEFEFLDNPLGFSFYKLDPTSSTRLFSVFSKDHTQVSIAMDSQEDSLAVYKIIRQEEKSVTINILDFWTLDLEDEYLNLIDIKTISANRMVSSLPDLPVIAEHIGLGQGEIMEITVPVSSPYAYRHLLNIEQAKWKIAAIYRGGYLLLPRPSLMLRPNDTILAVGQPSILRNVFKAIRSDIGQFPSPYGKNVYYILDLKDKEQKDIELELSNAINFHKRINSKLMHIRIIRPNDTDLIRYIRQKTQEDESIDISIAYRHFARDKDFLNDIEHFAAGVIVVNDDFFSHQHNRNLLFNSKKAVLKLGLSDINQLELSGMFISQNKNIEFISSPLFDLSIELSLEILLFNITPDLSENKDAIEHLENLSGIYEKKVKIVKKRGNPVREFVKYKDILQFLPFTKATLKSSFVNVLKIKNVEKQHRFMSKFHQIFIPVLEEN